MMISVNMVAVVAAAVANMIIGFIWYSMPVFGKPWMKLLGMTKEDLEKAKKEMGPKYGVMVIASLVMAYVLAHILAYVQAGDDLMLAFSGAFWVWLGFVATIGLNSVIFENRPISLYLINVGYYLVSLLVMSAVLTLV